MITANAPEKVPKGAATVAAWLNIPEIGGAGGWNADGSILQAQSAGPSFVTHFQLQGNGSIRLALRGELQDQNIVNSGGPEFSGQHPYPNQPEIDASGAEPELWPLNEWFHVAYTYDKTANAGAGEFAMYFNGEKIRSGPPNGLTLGEPTGAIDLGAWADRGALDFYDGLAIGSVPDGTGGRRLHGLMDEFYIFSRALSEAEIATLASDATSPDLDSDGDVDGADFLLAQRDSFSTVSVADFKAAFGPGGVSSVPEPSSLYIAAVVAAIGAGYARRRTSASRKPA